MAFGIERRKFISALGGAAVAWPLTARTQERERMPRIGVLMNLAADDAEGQARLAAFLQGLKEAGWVVGRNVSIDLRWGAADPVGAGLVASLARPGGNATGFTTFEFSMGGKWLELLKQVAPSVTRALILRDSNNPTGMGLFGAIQAVAPSLGIELRPADVDDPDAIERAIGAFAGGTNGGLVVTQNALAIAHRKLIITLAARHRLPAVYSYPSFVTDGGLISYGPDSTDGYRRAAGYVNRILKGEKPADLPVQAPTKYELAVNLKTAKALGLDVPAQLLARADKVIE